MPTNIKIIKGHSYLYYIYYENGNKKDMYCGAISNPESKKKAIKFEINHLKEQKIILSKKIRKLENSLKKK